MGLRPLLFLEQIMAQFMLYKQGSMITCGSLSLDYITVEEEDVKSAQESGWVLDPCHVVNESETPDEASGEDKGEISDGYHTFNELYAHRVRLFSTLMRVFAGQAWWSLQHSDGEQWEGWILAGIDTPEGTITYHLPESEIPNLPEGTEIEFGKEWDGHTAEDVLLRLVNLNLPETETEPEPAKKTRKTKAADDEQNEG